MTNESRVRAFLGAHPMAVECYPHSLKTSLLSLVAEVERSARASERERCAKVVGSYVDELRIEASRSDARGRMYFNNGAVVADIAAKRIRALPAAADNSGEETTG